MKTLACRDMGRDCDYVARDETDQGVMRLMMDHHRKVHPDYPIENEAEMMKVMIGEIKQDM